MESMDNRSLTYGGDIVVRAALDSRNLKGEADIVPSCDESQDHKTCQEHSIVQLHQTETYNQNIQSHQSYIRSSPDLDAPTTDKKYI